MCDKPPHFQFNSLNNFSTEDAVIEEPQVKRNDTRIANLSESELEKLVDESQSRSTKYSTAHA